MRGSPLVSSLARGTARFDVRGLLLTLVLGTSGCVSHGVCPPFAALESLLVEAGEARETSVEVRRNGHVVASHEHMFLERGDTLTTDGQTTALVSFAGGRVVLKPKTSVVIGIADPLADPAGTATGPSLSLPSTQVAGSKDTHAPGKAKEASDAASVEKSGAAAAPGSGAGVQKTPERWSLPWIFASFGELIGIGKIGVKTTSATGAVRGTKYQVKVDRAGRSTFTVLEGQVSIKPTQARWAAVTLNARQRLGVSLDEPRAPEPQIVPMEEIDGLLSEVQALGGERGVELPMLVGLDVGAAQAKLLALGLSESRAQFVPYSPERYAAAQIGQVVEQKPVAGARSAYVVLTVLGVPDLTALNEAQAARVLKAVGLRLGPVDGHPGADPSGSVVVAQVPGAGAGAAAGASVAVTLVSLSRSGTESRAATGPVEGSAQPTAPQQALPDVTGVPLPTAIVSLRAAGFTASVELRARKDLKQPRVVSQAPLPGQQVSTATPVQLLVAVPERAELALPTGQSPGQRESADQPVRALVLLDEALTFAERADWRNAQAKLEHARARAEYPNIVFHLAESHAHLTEWREARKALRQFEQIAGLHNPHLQEVADLRKLVDAGADIVTLPRATRQSHIPLGPVLTAAGGGAVLLSALITGLLAGEKEGELSRNCEASGFCMDGDLKEVRDDGDQLKLTTNVLLGLGGAAVLGGALWWYFARREARVQASAMCSDKGCVGNARLAF